MQKSEISYRIFKGVGPSRVVNMATGDVTVNIGHFDLQKGHLHFIFKFRYGSVERRMISIKKCEAKKPNAGERLYFRSKSHCVFIETYKGIKKQASEHKIDRFSLQASFDMIVPNVPLENITDYQDRFFTKEDLEEVLGRYVVSSKKVTNVTDKMIEEMTEAEDVDPSEIKARLIKAKQDMLNKIKNVDWEGPCSIST